MAAALNAAYTGYFMQLDFTPERMETYLHVNDIDLDASSVWNDNGAPAAIALVGVRGDRAWLGAFGIAPNFRGKGLSKAAIGEIIRAAKRKHARTIQLEVLEVNEQAIRIYERHGFSKTRSLHTLATMARPVDGTGADLLTGDEFLEDTLPHNFAPPWQRDLRGLETRRGQLLAIQRDAAYILAIAGGGAATIFAANFPEDRDATELVGALSAKTSSPHVELVNEPQNSALYLQLTRLGWTQQYLQYEMQRDL